MCMLLGRIPTESLLKSPVVFSVLIFIHLCTYLIEPFLLEEFVSLRSDCSTRIGHQSIFMVNYKHMHCILARTKLLQKLLSDQIRVDDSLLATQPFSFLPRCLQTKL